MTPLEMTPLETAIKRLVEAARTHSTILMGEDSIDLPEDESAMSVEDRVNAVASYLEETC